MVDQRKIKSLSIALGTTFAVSLPASSFSNPADNPFAATQLENGYMVAAHHEGKCGEGKCGEKKAEGKCGEGKCGEKKAEGQRDGKKAEGKCGEGKCGN